MKFVFDIPTVANLETESRRCERNKFVDRRHLGKRQIPSRPPRAIRLEFGVAKKRYLQGATKQGRSCKPRGSLEYEVRGETLSSVGNSKGITRLKQSERRVCLLL
jgi:hypothetical protein